MDFFYFNHQGQRGNSSKCRQQALLYITHPFLCVFDVLFAHHTTFVEGFVTRREDALSDNSCLGIS